jgi:hypothetical protein
MSNSTAAAERRQTAESSRPDQEPRDEYEHLRRKKQQQRGNVVTATVRAVDVGASTVSLSLRFEWTGEPATVHYDLDDERDVAKLTALCEAHGFEFEQVSHLEGLTVDVVYTGQRWVPEAHAASLEGEGSVGETFRTELALLARELARSPRFLRRAIRTARELSLQQTVIAAIIVKKLAIIAILAWVLL